jgi:hypothetical protein
MNVSAAGTLLPFAILLASCGSSSSEMRLKALEKLHSWTATARMVSKAWRSGSVSKAYTIDTLKLASQKVGEQTRQLKRVPVPAFGDSHMRGDLDRIGEVIVRLTAAVIRADDASVCQGEEQLAAEEQILNSLRNRGPDSE